ncbi:MAG: hypothetical protein KAR40_03970 [Candidatus Sabulitectum sp.]|nr:hypothetical protein [Candidatus Sabulitectum sp.]
MEVKYHLVITASSFLPVLAVLIILFVTTTLLLLWTVLEYVSGWRPIPVLYSIC